MRLFVRVADAGSFSRAAEEAGIGQPTVSRRIQDLEHRLNAQLFNRTTRALSMTEAGHRFYERAQAILDEFDDAEAEARGLDQEPVGLLRITATQSLGRLVLSPRLCQFMRLYPHLRLDLYLDDNVVDLVGEGVDLALRFGTLEDSSLMARKLVDSPRFLLASPRYIEEFGAPEKPEDLVDHEVLTFRQVSGAAIQRFERDGEVREVPVTGRIKSSSGEVLRQAAVDGLGLQVAPDWLVAEAMDRGDLVPVMTDWTLTPLTLHAIWPSGRKLRGKAKLFVEYLADALKHGSRCAVTGDC